mgnify:CR=1 FL=1
MALAALFYGLFAQGIWRDQRAANILDGAAPFYDTYETKDGKFVAIAPIETKFYAEFLAKLGIDPASLPKQNDVKRWPETKARFAAAIKAKTDQISSFDFVTAGTRIVAATDSGGVFTAEALANTPSGDSGPTTDKVVIQQDGVQIR